MKTKCDASETETHVYGKYDVAHCLRVEVVSGIEVGARRIRFRPEVYVWRADLQRENANERDCTLGDGRWYEGKEEGDC